MRQRDETEGGEKVICHRERETGEVWRVLASWAGTSEKRWQLLMVTALLESAEWTQDMAATALRLSRPRIAQIAAEARSQLPRAFEPSPRDLAGAG